jgi:type IV secretory pathway protease TraF
MVPTYAPGEYVWAVRRFLYPGNLQGRIVICPDPDSPDRELVKRVSEIRRTDVSDDVVLGGDNHEASRDSRVFGTVPLRRITWVVMPNRRPF